MLKLHIEASEIESIFNDIYVLSNSKEKSGSSHLFGVVPKRAAHTAFMLELSKAITSLSNVVSW